MAQGTEFQAAMWEKLGWECGGSSPWLSGTSGNEPTGERSYHSLSFHPPLSLPSLLSPLPPLSPSLPLSNPSFLLPLAPSPSPLPHPVSTCDSSQLGAPVAPSPCGTSILLRPGSDLMPWIPGLGTCEQVSASVLTSATLSVKWSQWLGSKSSQQWLPVPTQQDLGGHPPCNGKCSGAS